MSVFEYTGIHIKTILYLYIAIVIMETEVINAFRDGHCLAAEDGLETVVFLVVDLPITVGSRSSDLHVIMVQTIHWLTYNVNIRNKSHSCK